MPMGIVIKHGITQNEPKTHRMTSIQFNLIFFTHCTTNIYKKVIFTKQDHKEICHRDN